MDPKRFISGILLAAFVILFVRFAPLQVFKAFVLIVNGIAIHEFLTLTLPKHRSSAIIWGTILGEAFSASILWFSAWPMVCLGILILCVILTFTYYLFADHDLSLVLSQITLTICGIVYVNGLLSIIGLTFALPRPQGVFWVFLTLGCTFMADTGAYLFGNLFGTRKIAPKVSPGKTVEGLLGGILFSWITALICRALFWKGITVESCLVLGTLTGIIGPIGDLSESLIKRSLGVKDSGKLIPGHGGILDRIDALLFNIPLVYFYATQFYG